MSENDLSQKIRTCVFANPALQNAVCIVLSLFGSHVKLCVHIGLPRGAGTGV